MAKGSRFTASDFEPPLHISHRGGSAIGPENTLPTFRKAAEDFGTEVLEIDVRRSSDGVVVVHHDEDVTRTTSGTGSVDSQTLAELQELDAGYHFTLDGGRNYPCRGSGYRIPALTEVFEALPELLYHIDIKQDRPPIVDDVVNLIREGGLERQVFIGSTYDRIARQVRAAAHDMATFPAKYGLWKLFISHRLKLFPFYRLRDEVVSIVPRLPRGTRVVTREFVDALHRRGRKVFAFVIDNPVEQRDLLEMGVDGIMTDRPDVLRKTIDEWRRKDND